MDIKISQLPTGGTLSGSELLEMVQGGASVSTTPNAIKTFVGALANPMTTAGDIITGGSAGAAQRLAKGSNGQVLTMVSGAPAWADGSSGGPTVISSNTTKNIGADGDFATLTLAKAWLDSVLIMAGAQVTLNVLSGTTLNEQVVFANKDYGNVSIVFNGATVNATGFAGNALISGVAPFITCLNCVTPIFTGSVTIGTQVASTGILAIGCSAVNLGNINTETAFSCSGGTESVSTFLIASSVTAFQLTAGLIGQALRGVISYGTLAVMQLQGGSSDLTLDHCSMPNVQNTDGTLIISNSTINCSGSASAITNAYGRVISRGNTVACAGGFSGAFVSSTGGSFTGDNPTVTGTSSGPRYSVANGAIIAGPSSNLASAFAADNQSDTTPAAAGLILA